jgi:hypothetical protein
MQELNIKIIIYQTKKYMQSTYKVTLRRFRVTIVAVEKQSVLHIMSVFV